MNLKVLCLFIISASIIRVEAQTTVQTLLSGAIRLARDGVPSSSYSSGRVQVYGIAGANSAANRWGNICRLTSFGTREADVVCHQLTYTGASSHSYAQIDSFGNDSYTALLDDVSCTNDNYLMIFQCAVSTAISTSCTANQDVSVTCYSTRIWDDPYNGMVRLSQGNYVNTGLLEVYCKGEWGTVCDDTFGAEDGTAVCRQLGYSSYYRYGHLIYVGSTEQPIWLNELSCVSGDRCLSDCQRCPGSAVSACVHSEDITITCYSPTASGSSNTIGLCKYNNNAVIIGATFGSIGGVIIIIIIIVLILRDKEKKGQTHIRRDFRAWKAKMRPHWLKVKSCWTKTWTKTKLCCKKLKCKQRLRPIRAVPQQPPAPAPTPVQPASQSAPPQVDPQPAAQPPPYSSNYSYPPQPYGAYPPPGVYPPPGAYPPGAYPPGAYPPAGVYPPAGAYPPATYPPPGPSYPPAPDDSDIRKDEHLRKEEPPSYDSNWS